MNPTNQNRSIEPWLLSAYLLGELDAEASAKIEAALAADPSLASEADQLRSTIGVVRGIFDHEYSVESSAELIAASNSVAANSVSTNSVAGDSTSSTAGVPLIQAATQSSHNEQSASYVSKPPMRKPAAGSSRLQWIGLLAMSCCLALAMLLMRDLWDQSPNNLAQRPENAPFDSKTSATDELTTRLIDAKTETSTERMARRTTASSPTASVESNTAGEVTAGGNTLKSLTKKDAGTSDEDDVVFAGEDYLVESNESLREGPAASSLARIPPTSSSPGASSGGGRWGQGSDAMGGAETGIGGEGEYEGGGGGLGGGLGGGSLRGGGMGGGGFGVGPGGGGPGGMDGGGMGSGEHINDVKAQWQHAGRRKEKSGNSFDSYSDSNQALGDEQFEFVESVGLIVVKGSKQEVERVQALIEKIKAQENVATEQAIEILKKRNTRNRLPSDSNQSRYTKFVENKFQLVGQQPLSTFSIDVDTASYAKCRQLLMESGSIPPAAAVRLEEFINYFDYDYQPPRTNDPFATHLAVANCPWKPEHQLVRVALQTAKPNLEERAAANVVFLIDVSGSMNQANKLPLVKDAMRMMIQQLNGKDRVAMVVYAGAAGCVLEGTPGSEQKTILGALDRLQAGGSTNGGQGIQLAYQLARDQFIPGGNNRVVLCTDGDFNVGVTDTEDLVHLIAESAKSKIFLTVLGFGMDNTNDQMMKKIANRGNGVYGFVDSWREAKRQLVDQLASNLITVAKDVKIQVEFNPEFVKAYRLLGYENRILAARDFNDDTKDAGEIGSGHRVTALYEVVPVGLETELTPEVDELLFQSNKKQPAIDHDRSAAAGLSQDEQADREFSTNAMLAVKLRYKQPEGDVSKKLVFPLSNQVARFQDVDQDFRWAASMAQFGMLLRDSHYAGNSSWSGLIEQAQEAAGADPARAEAVQMIQRANALRNGR